MINYDLLNFKGNDYRYYKNYLVENDFLKENHMGSYLDMSNLSIFSSHATWKSQEIFKQHSLLTKDILKKSLKCGNTKLRRFYLTNDLMFTTAIPPDICYLSSDITTKFSFKSSAIKEITKEYDEQNKKTLLYNYKFTPVLPLDANFPAQCMYCRTQRTNCYSNSTMIIPANIAPVLITNPLKHGTNKSDIFIHVPFICSEANSLENNLTGLYIRQINFNVFDDKREIGHCYVCKKKIPDFTPDKDYILCKDCNIEYANVNKHITNISKYINDPNYSFTFFLNIEVFYILSIIDSIFWMLPYCLKSVTGSIDASEFGCNNIWELFIDKETNKLSNKIDCTNEIKSVGLALTYFCDKVPASTKFLHDFLNMAIRYFGYMTIAKLVGINPDCYSKITPYFDYITRRFFLLSSEKIEDRMEALKMSDMNLFDF